jgi:hypothetical protein
LVTDQAITARNSYANIIWAGTNGGWIDAADWVERIKHAISALNTDKYIVVGIHYDSMSANFESLETAATAEFGIKFFNWRLYASSNAMYDYGITPSSDDLTRMASGLIPTTFLADAVHLSIAAYDILANELYKYGRDILMYW